MAYSNTHSTASHTLTSNLGKAWILSAAKHSMRNARTSRTGLDCGGLQNATFFLQARTCRVYIQELEGHQCRSVISDVIDLRSAGFIQLLVVGMSTCKMSWASKMLTSNSEPAVDPCNDRASHMELLCLRKPYVNLCIQGEWYPLGAQPRHG